MYSLNQDQSFLWLLSIMVLVWAYVTRRKYKCQICEEFARDTYPPVLQHIGEVHGFEPNFHVVCVITLDSTQAVCPATYTNHGSFRSHVYTKHGSSHLHDVARFCLTYKFVCSTICI